jgi:ribonuclease-3
MTNKDIKSKLYTIQSIHPINLMLKLPTIKNETLRLCALTHRSYINENPQAGESNERLEFLGDAVLNFLIGELVYQRYPQMSEAQLTRMRSYLVDEKQLAKFANQLKIGDLMRLGNGAIKEGGQKNPALLSDTFEAIIGAYELDAGIDAVRKYVHKLFIPIADEIAQTPVSQLQAKTALDFKSQLQQWTQERYVENPEYCLIEESGPDHAKEFTVAVRINGKVCGIGQGNSKKNAEKHAAQEALGKVKNSRLR